MKTAKPHKPKTAWKEADKIRAVAIYKSVGSLGKTAELSGIPYDTILVWVRQEWWTEKLNQLKTEDSAELQEATTNIAKLSLGAVQDRLVNGDFVLDRDGKLVRKPMSGRDAAIVAGISITKRKELGDEPVREQQLGNSERLLKLVEQFARFAQSKEVKRIVEQQKVIEGEYTIHAKHDETTSQNDGSSGSQPEIREESGNSGESGEGIQPS